MQCKWMHLVGSISEELKSLHSQSFNYLPVAAYLCWLVLIPSQEYHQLNFQILKRLFKKNHSSLDIHRIFLSLHSQQLSWRAEELPAG